MRKAGQEHECGPWFLPSLWLQVCESDLFINKRVGKSVNVVIEFGEVREGLDERKRL